MTSAEYEQTIPRLLAAAADRNPGGIWLRSDAGSLTFAGAAAAVARGAQALAEAGAGKGDMVILTAATTPEYLLSWLAVTTLGAVAVGVNPRSSPAELAGLIRQVEPRLLVTDAEVADLLAANRDGEAAHGDEGRTSPFPPEVDVADVVPADWSDPAAMAQAARSAKLPAAGVGADDVAVLIPTSGTTGRSKLVMQTHRTYAMTGEGFPFWTGLTADDRMLTTLPLFHLNAPAYSVMGSLAIGAGLVVGGRFSASHFIDIARRHGATQFNAIGAMLEILMRQPERPDDADNPLRLCYTGPPPARDRQLEMEHRFGFEITAGFGMSESPYGMIWPPASTPDGRAYGSLGVPRQHPYLGDVNEARLVDDSGSVLRPGPDGPGPDGASAVGEIELRNPTVMLGYYGMPEETAAALHDGWLRTGDLATRGADGIYRYVARKKEVIRRRGENLSPLEVEEVLLSHPAVLEVAVIGVPSELSEEEVKAFVVPVAGTELDFAELRDHAAQRLAAFKVPRYWQHIGELPRTPTQRVAKHQLSRDRTPEEHDADR